MEGTNMIRKVTVMNETTGAYVEDWFNTKITGSECLIEVSLKGTQDISMLTLSIPFKIVKAADNAEGINYGGALELKATTDANKLTLPGRPEGSATISMSCSENQIVSERNIYHCYPPFMFKRIHVVIDSNTICQIPENETQIVSFRNSYIRHIMIHDDLEESRPQPLTFVEGCTTSPVTTEVDINSFWNKSLLNYSKEYNFSEAVQTEKYFRFEIGKLLKRYMPNKYQVYGNVLQIYLYFHEGENLDYNVIYKYLDLFTKLEVLKEK